MKTADTKEQSALTEIINSIILSSSNQNYIQPSWVAYQAFLNLDPTQVSPMRVRIAALATLKQIAAKLLRGNFEAHEDSESNQHELWPYLQTRYPAVHKKGQQEPVYVLLECMTDEDVAWNVERLSKEAKTKMKHARALKDWGARRSLKNRGIKAA